MKSYKNIHQASFAKHFRFPDVEVATTAQVKSGFDWSAAKTEREAATHTIQELQARHGPRPTT